MAKTNIRSFYVPTDKLAEYTDFINCLEVYNTDKRHKKLSLGDVVMQGVEVWIKDFKAKNGNLILKEKQQSVNNPLQTGGKAVSPNDIGQDQTQPALAANPNEIKV